MTNNWINVVGVQPMMAPTGKKYKLTVEYASSSLFRLAKNQDECLRYPDKHYVVNVKFPVDI